MTSAERLRKVAQRRRPTPQDIAERMFVFESANNLLDRFEFEGYDVMDVLAVAEFLAGDRR